MNQSVKIKSLLILSAIVKYTLNTSKVHCKSLYLEESQGAEALEFSRTTIKVKNLAEYLANFLRYCITNKINKKPKSNNTSCLTIRTPSVLLFNFLH